MTRNIGVSVVTPRKECADDLCPFHGTLSVRGKLLKGIVTSSKAKKMVVVSREYPRSITKIGRAHV